MAKRNHGGRKSWKLAICPTKWGGAVNKASLLKLQSLPPHDILLQQGHTFWSLPTVPQNEDQVVIDGTMHIQATTGTLETLRILSHGRSNRKDCLLSVTENTAVELGLWGKRHRLSNIVLGLCKVSLGVFSAHPDAHHDPQGSVSRY